MSDTNTPTKPAREWWLYKSVSDDHDTLTAVVVRDGDDGSYPSQVRVIEHSTYLEVCERLETVNSTNRLKQMTIIELQRQRDELQSKYDELISYMPKVPQEPYEKSLAKEIIELRKENERQVLALKNLTEENEHLCAGAREEYNRILEAYNEIKNQHKMLSILSSALEKEALALRAKCETYEGTLNRIALMQAGALDGTKDFFEFVKCEVRGALKKHK